MRQLLLSLLGATLLLTLASAPTASAQGPYRYQLQHWYYYPFYYFPHNYWPTMGPKYPERPNEPYRKPPAYMAYPAFHEPGWRYELWTPQRYHRGFHFWLDQF